MVHARAGDRLYCLGSLDDPDAYLHRRGYENALDFESWQRRVDEVRETRHDRVLSCSVAVILLPLPHLAASFGPKGDRVRVKPDSVHCRELDPAEVAGQGRQDRPVLRIQRQLRAAAGAIHQAKRRLPVLEAEDA
ncbi:MAG: hypothetical protein ACE5F1_11925 [Planctomycetota bacterium]